jgi:hypothetical protein
MYKNTPEGEYNFDYDVEWIVKTMHDTGLFSKDTLQHVEEALVTYDPARLITATER